MRARLLTKACRMRWWLPAIGPVSSAVVVLPTAAGVWEPSTLLTHVVVVTGVGHWLWTCVLLGLHSRWLDGRVWSDVEHRCDGDDEGDDEFEPPPDDPDDDETAGLDTPTIRIRSTYTLAA